MARKNRFSDAVSKVAEKIAEVAIKQQEKKNSKKNVVAKYNYRLKKMKEQGVDMDFVYDKLKKTIGEDKLKGNNIRTKGLTEQNLRALEAQLPEEKTGREYDYSAYRDKIEEEKKYRKKQEELRQLELQQKSYKDAMDEQINRFLDAIYDSRDEKTREKNDNWNELVRKNPELADDIYRTLTGQNYKTWKKPYGEGGKYSYSLASRIARGDVSPEEVEKTIDEWVENGLVIPE